MNVLIRIYFYYTLVDSWNSLLTSAMYAPLSFTERYYRNRFGRRAQRKVKTISRDNKGE